MLSKKEVEHVAQLARLGLSEKEIEKMKKDLSLILDYIEKLKEVDISGVDFYVSSAGLKNIMRQDKAERKGYGAKLIKLAPKKEKGYLRTKQVL